MANRKKRRHVCVDGLCFHGAFNRKSDAEAKARTVRGRVKGHLLPGGYRYVVTTGKRNH